MGDRDSSALARVETLRGNVDAGLAATVLALQERVGNQATLSVVGGNQGPQHHPVATPVTDARDTTIQRATIAMTVADYMSVAAGPSWQSPDAGRLPTVRSELAAYFRYFVASELLDAHPSKRHALGVDEAFRQYSAAMDRLRAAGGESASVAEDVAHAADTLRSLVAQLNLAELDIEHLQLDQPAALPPEYDAFADKVFGNDRIMNVVTGGLDDEVYALYSGGTEPTNLRVVLGRRDDEPTFRKYYGYWKGILTAASGHPCELQSSGHDLRDTLGWWKTWFSTFRYSADADEFCRAMESWWLTWARSFVFVTAQGGVATYRVYANLTLDSVPGVTSQLIQLPGVCDFKFAGPADFGDRSEGLVVYCVDRRHAEEAANVLGRVAVVQRGRPEMTEASGASGGIGIGAEPGAVATGMRTRLPEQGTGDYAADVQSFGMIRSELIASAVLHLRLNHDLAGKLGITDRELFKRFVGVALRGWSSALDPTAG